MRRAGLGTALFAALLNLPDIAFADQATRDLQQALLDRGFDPNGVDGQIGVGTRKAFRSFWQASQLSLSDDALTKSTAGYFASLVLGFDDERLQELRAQGADEVCKDSILAAGAALTPYDAGLSSPGTNATVQAFAGKLQRPNGRGEDHPMILLFDHDANSCWLLGAWRAADGNYLFENGSYVYPWQRSGDGRAMEISAQLINSTLVLNKNGQIRKIPAKGF